MYTHTHIYIYIYSILIKIPHLHVVLRLRDDYDYLELVLKYNVIYCYLLIFYSCRFLIQYVHPGTIPLVLIGLLGAFYVLMFLLKAGCTDPGFIPRARQDEAHYNQGLGEPGKQ